MLPNSVFFSRLTGDGLNGGIICVLTSYNCWADLMMGLSNYALEKMGFLRIPEGQEIEAQFKSLNIYEIRGICSSGEFPFLPNKIKQETNGLSVSIGDSVNAVCQALIGDDFIQDEDLWRTENKTNPPYLIVLAVAPVSVSCKNGYLQHDDGKIITYSCFTHAKEALRKLEKEMVATFVTSLSAGLSTQEHPVAFIPIAREVFGVTTDNKIVYDFRATGKAEIIVSKPVTSDALASNIEDALSASREFHPNVGYFFDLATRENDILKKFLYYYLAIEIHVHKEFERIDHFQSTEQLDYPSETLGPLALKFFVEHDQAKNLSQRFIWCSLLRWVDVGESDFMQFREIKRFRDNIYHGEEISEGALPVNQARQLALKILRHKNQL